MLWELWVGSTRTGLLASYSSCRPTASGLLLVRYFYHRFCATDPKVPPFFSRIVIKSEQANARLR